MAKGKQDSKGSYSAKDITVLEGLEPVRKRPGMYIGTTGPDGLHHLIWEVFDNSRDEAMAGEADNIEVTLLPDSTIRVVDNGRGIPVDKHPKTKVSALETIMTTLHAGGKFGGEGYKVSGGLHGVGVSVVNALSVMTRAEVHKGGDVYMQEYNIGKAKALVKKIGKSKEKGTVITFRPDDSIFETVEFSWDKIVAHLRQQAYLVKGVRISILDARNAEIPDLAGKFYLADLAIEMPSQSFYFEEGLRSLVGFRNQYQTPVHKNIFYVDRTIGDVQVEIALQYVEDISSRLTAFANNTHNPDGGTHMTGFKTALTRTLNVYSKKNNLTKDESFTGDDVLEGITAVISVKLPEIQFEGQTKSKLGSVEARGAVETVFGEGFSYFLEENPDDAKRIIGKIALALKARKAAKAAKDSVLRKGALEGMTLPGKLADCSSKSAEESEIFIVEGDSAGGSSKQARDRRTQAILPLRGKILNVERARIDRMLASAEIKALVIAMGTAIGDVFDISKLRYHKIIIATDADVDGAHIRTLLLTLFYRYFKPIIEGGFLYIAQPPLFKIQQGKKITYVYTEEEKTALLGDDADVVEEDGSEEEGDDAPKRAAPKARIQRYKGLGEMNPDELWETTMDPENRVLKRVTIEDSIQADKIFDILMGTDVPSRKHFIQTNAKLAKVDL
ncbi:type IIA DNA topoisomerase subunit B [Candidatus Wolfebacteria bacterium]|nr:type IIA DNA topoisomerase subunit B [Candidatus Wolfebacteria bacterium]